MRADGGVKRNVDVDVRRAVVVRGLREGIFVVGWWVGRSVGLVWSTRSDGEDLEVESAQLFCDRCAIATAPILGRACVQVPTPY